MKGVGDWESTQLRRSSVSSHGFVQGHFTKELLNRVNWVQEGLDCQRSTANLRVRSDQTEKFTNELLMELV